MSSTNKPYNASKAYDLIVVGDEVEGIITAVSAAKQGVQVALVRRSKGILGGLSTRGGLSYMDITWEWVTGLFQAFLAQAGVKRVALYPEKAATILQEWLSEAGIPVFSGFEVQPQYHQEQDTNGHWQCTLIPTDSDNIPENPPTVLTAHHLIDSTPDLDLARGLGIPYTEGLGNLFQPAITTNDVKSMPQRENFLGISPVFKLTGIDRQDFIAFEQRLRQDPALKTHLVDALPYHAEGLRAELLERPVFSPDDEDYIDILNPIIGIAFHHWRNGDYNDYSEAKIAIDGFNTARLPRTAADQPEPLAMNGLVMRSIDCSLEDLIAFSQEKKAFPTELIHAVEDFQTFLQSIGGFSQAQCHLPESLYIRQTLNIQAKHILTARELLTGGVIPEEAIGTFSYWLDLRGIPFNAYFPNEHLAKPLFNVGLNDHLPLPQAQQALGFDHFAMLGRSCGYSPLAQGACRIIQHGAIAGEALGIAAALAIQNNGCIQSVSPKAVRRCLKARYSNEPAIAGKPTADPEFLKHSKALKQDDTIAIALSEQMPQKPRFSQSVL